MINCLFSVLFQIELLSFVDHRAADEFSSFSREERENATLDQIIAVANAEKDVSYNNAFSLLLPTPLSLITPPPQLSLLPSIYVAGISLLYFCSFILGW